MRDAVCRSGDSHYVGCPCHEARWAAKLAASEARAEQAISDTVQEFGLRRAAEARVRALEEALRHAARELQYIADDDPCHRLHQTEEGLACIRLAESLLGPMREWRDEPNATVSTGFRVWKIRAALAGKEET